MMQGRCLRFVTLLLIALLVGIKISTSWNHPITPAITSTVLVQQNDIAPSWHGFQSNRTLALIHVGKSAGLSLRALTSLKCRLPRKQVTPESIEKCLLETFGNTDPQTNPLVLQTIFYAHMKSIPPVEMNQATSWLIALRNPLERVFSAFQYSHPATCQDVELQPNSTKGCTNRFILEKRARTTIDNNTKKKISKSQARLEQQLHELFQVCFPSADVEVFVQSAAAAAAQYGARTRTSNADENVDCSHLARLYITGKAPVFPIPHLFYNYHHYVSRVLEAYDPSMRRELFGIRTEHLWEDFTALNAMIGGRNSVADNSHSDTRPVKLTHGSEKYRSSSSSSLSSSAYERLCCLLKDELFRYRDLVRRLWNLDESTKYATIQELAQKCGMLENVSSGSIQGADWVSLWSTWETWNRSCVG
jgi:hypothetical protein